jgi:hypothetical protein
LNDGLTKTPVLGITPDSNNADFPLRQSPAGNLYVRAGSNAMAVGAARRRDAIRERLRVVSGMDA